MNRKRLNCQITGVTPDFYLPEVGWIEIKATPEDARRAEAKLRMFASERYKIIGPLHRKEFYTICGTQPDFDIHRFHRWQPEPAEICWAEDIYLLFCGSETRKTAERMGKHPVEWIKGCLAKARSPLEPLRDIEEGIFAYRHHELGTSFTALSRSVRAGNVMPLTANEIEQLRRLHRMRNEPGMQLRPNS